MIVPIILAAGASSRMGSPKPLLEFDGVTALELALDALGGLAAPLVVLGADRTAIETRVDLTRARVVVNADASGGLTASLCAALRLLDDEAEAFVFLPVDHPLVRRREVGRLIDTARACPGCDVFVPAHRGRRGHPVLCRRRVATAILALPPGAIARTAIYAHPSLVREVESDDPAVLTDMNTPEDYARCLEAFRARARAGTA
jgi:CTP:molybdopterin cytidylyltransferase MocA